MTETTMSLMDVALARQAINSDQAEEQLMRRLYPKIYQVSKFIAGNSSHADDIAQLAALEILKSLQNFKGMGSLEAWAGRITCRTAHRFLRHANLRQNKPALSAVEVEALPGNDTPEKSLSRRQSFDKMVDKLSPIPEFRRTTLLLHLAFGYTIAEISYITGTSKNTVKGRLKTAFKELREIIKNNPEFVGDTLEEMR
ncbi:MAG: sigma-70 family RNA polymerase sigma factor [Deltaproteobacteria bacterium]|nr:sigma-70 family RNA polymerase sigma factor [Deltaproteobacteria bacterium]